MFLELNSADTADSRKGCHYDLIYRFVVVAGKFPYQGKCRIATKGLPLC